MEKEQNGNVLRRLSFIVIVQNGLFV